VLTRDLGGESERELVRVLGRELGGLLRGALA
jgi:hypothetical protein